MDMDMSISRPVQIFAIVAVIAAAAGGALLMTKPKHAAAPPVVGAQAAQLPGSGSAPTGASQSPSTAAPKPSTGTRTAPPTSVAPVSKHAAAGPAAKKTPPVGENGLPSSIDEAFREHAVVVVSLFDPDSSTDAISYAEAKAGASEAGVGFVGVNLLDSTAAAALTSALPGGGLLPEPGILIYRKPGTLVDRLDGFNDRDIVAQAASSSVTAAPVTGDS
jgi:hypothetical protein